MAQKRDLWYSNLLLATSNLGRFRFNANSGKYKYATQRFEFAYTVATRIRYPNCQSRLHPLFSGSGTPWFDLRLDH